MSSVPAIEEFTSCNIAGTSMATVCSDHKGVLVADFLYQGTTANVDSYFVTLLLLRATIKTKRPGLFSKGVLLLHDNNRPQSANATQLLLQPFRWEILEHPAYSVVLAPSDCHAFSAKRSFWPPQISKWFRSEESYVAAVAIAGHGLSSTGILKATSVIWQIFQFFMGATSKSRVSVVQLHVYCFC